jgi:branched-chain amino acid transport system permease protein
MTRPCGVFNVDYHQERAIVRTRLQRMMLLIFLGFMLFLFPRVVPNVYVSLVSYMGIFVIAFQGLNIITGYAGQISVGHAAFMAVGGYTSAILVAKVHLPFPLALLLAGVVAAAIGAVFGAPSVRIKGFYLALCTLAAHFIIIYIISNWKSLTGGPYGITVPPASVAGVALKSTESYYYLVMVMTVVMTFFALNITRTKAGRAFIAIRDNDIAAEVMGINIFRYKLLAFAIGTFYAGIAGALIAHQWRFVNTDFFPLMDAVWYLGMLVVGGLGSNLGPIFGAVVYRGLAYIVDSYSPVLATMIPWGHAEQFATFGLLVYATVIILFLMFEPRGLAHRWHLFKARYRLFPFSY